jgi:hypothetical protein
MPPRKRDTRPYMDFFQARQSLVTAAAISLAAEDSQFGFRRSRYLRVGFRAERVPK